jgi:hypothetical protein
MQIDLTQRADGGLKKFLYGRIGVKTCQSLKVKTSSYLHLGFIHVSREIGYDNFFNRLRGGTSCFGGSYYPSLGRGRCTSGSKNLSTCIVTTTRTLLLSCPGNRNNLYKEQKKTSDEVWVTTRSMKRTSSRDLSIFMSVEVLSVKDRRTEEGLSWS